MSSRRLEKKSVLLTGGASGIGLGIAELFLSEGAQLYILDRSEQNISSARQHLASHFETSRFVFVSKDAGSQDDIRQAIEDCVDRFGSIDITILNAGIYPAPKPLLEYDASTYEQVMRFNGFGGL